MPFVFVILACTKSNDNCSALILHHAFSAWTNAKIKILYVYIVFKVKQSVAQKISRYIK